MNEAERITGHPLTKEEEEFLRDFEAYLQRCGDKELSYQMKALAIHQARQIGDID